MDTGIASIISSIILFAGGIVASIIFSYVPRQRKETTNKLRKELYEVYIGVQQIKQVEESLEKQFGVSKQTARKGFEIPEKFEDSRIRKRINQLEKQIQ